MRDRGEFEDNGSKCKTAVTGATKEKLRCFESLQ
jgi:hypothetical protein